MSCHALCTSIESYTMSPPHVDPKSGYVQQSFQLVGGPSPLVKFIAMYSTLHSLNVLKVDNPNKVQMVIFQ